MSRPLTGSWGSRPSTSQSRFPRASYNPNRVMSRPTTGSWGSRPSTSQSRVSRLSYNPNHVNQLVYVPNPVSRNASTRFNRPIPLDSVMSRPTTGSWGSRPSTLQSRVSRPSYNPNHVNQLVNVPNPVSRNASTRFNRPIPVDSVMSRPTTGSWGARPSTSQSRVSRPSYNPNHVNQLVYVPNPVSRNASTRFNRPIPVDSVMSRPLTGSWRPRPSTSQSRPSTSQSRVPRPSYNPNHVNQAPTNGGGSTSRITRKRNMDSGGATTGLPGSSPLSAPPMPGVKISTVGNESDEDWEELADLPLSQNKIEQDAGKEYESCACSICLDTFVNGGREIKKLICGHVFHASCVDRALSMKSKCPLCQRVVGSLEGDQPANGRMFSGMDRECVHGYRGYCRIRILYTFQDGIQTDKHPHPGVPYDGTERVAYLPDNSEGRKVLELLRKAFQARLTFTVGRSLTSGRDNQIVWNDIHHKTDTSYGSMYGYPDPTYLQRVTADMNAMGIE